MSLDDTWTFDGTDWVQETPAGAMPSARGDHAMVFDTINRRIMLFGGGDDYQYYADAWFYQLSSLTADEICTDATDNDDDDAIDCEDPDCATHPDCF
jgi:hypothetical protein